MRGAGRGGTVRPKKNHETRECGGALELGMTLERCWFFAAALFELLPLVLFTSEHSWFVKSVASLGSCEVIRRRLDVIS